MFRKYYPRISLAAYFGKQVWNFGLVTVCFYELGHITYISMEWYH